MAGAGVVVDQPAEAANNHSPFRVAEARYYAAEARFNALPPDLELTHPSVYEQEEAALFAADDEANATPVADWREFADAFEIAMDRGQSLMNENTMYKLLADVRRLR